MSKLGGASAGVPLGAECADEMPLLAVGVTASLLSARWLPLCATSRAGASREVEVQLAHCNTALAALSNNAIERNIVVALHLDGWLQAKSGAVDRQYQSAR